MRHSIALLTLLSLLALSPAADPVRKDTPPDVKYLRDHAETRGFMLGRPAKAQPTPDGKAVLFLRSEPRIAKLALYEFDVASQKTRKLLTPEEVLKGAEETLTPEEKARRERMRVSVGGFTGFQLDENGSQILLQLSGRLYVVERAGKKVRELKTGEGTIIDPKFSPDGKKIGYVKDYDVYVYDLAADKESPVTKGGTEKKSHGLAEFVAQEEMDRHSGWWWSPDSQFIVYEEADADGVEVWYVADPAKPGQEPQPFFYPRPGKKNVAVRVGVVPVTGGETVWIDWDKKKYEYLTQVRWEEHGPPTITVQNRLQNELVLLKVDPKTGKTTQLLVEKDPAWVNVRQDVPRWLEGGKQFVWISSSEKGAALELRQADGTLERQLTAPRPSDLDLVDVDLKNGRAIFATGSDPTELRLYGVGREGWQRAPGLDVLTGKDAITTGVFSKNHSVYVLNKTDLHTMPGSTVQNHAGTAGNLPAVAEDPPFKPNIEMAKAGEDPGFYAAIVRPHNFDKTKKYPVIVYVYGGPGHQVVLQSMRSWLLPQWLADQGFIVVSIDNRGTPNRGRDFERAIYQKFGSVPLDDQVAGLQALGKKYPEMDLDHVGIYGWSFGGYMSALAVLKRPDVYKAAVAGAPVTDWEDYDTHYTERYLGLPQDNPQAYKDASLLTYAKNLKRPLLLIHGTADDNVYFRHSLRLADALFRNGKDFELLPLSGLTHMVPEPVVMENLYLRIARHFQKHLGVAK